MGEPVNTEVIKERLDAAKSARMNMANKDYYNILGIDRAASADDVHRAYRRRARELHPDRNKQDPRAEDKFKELGEAYRVLSHPQKRQQYDTLGKQGFDQRYTEEDIFRGADFNDIFRDIGGGGFSDIFRRSTIGS